MLTHMHTHVMLFVTQRAFPAMNKSISDSVGAMWSFSACNMSCSTSAILNVYIKNSTCWILRLCNNLLLVHNVQ